MVEVGQQWIAKHKQQVKWLGDIGMGMQDRRCGRYKTLSAYCITVCAVRLKLAGREWVGVGNL